VKCQIEFECGERTCDQCRFLRLAWSITDFICSAFTQPPHKSTIVLKSLKNKGPMRCKPCLALSKTKKKS
jgi:hypothetical protein